LELTVTGDVNASRGELKGPVNDKGDAAGVTVDGYVAHIKGRVMRDTEEFNGLVGLCVRVVDAGRGVPELAVERGQRW